jgi:hypothetical protein
MLSSKIKNFRDLTVTHGIFMAISETLRWMWCAITGQPYNGRYRIERKWTGMLASRKDMLGAEIGVRYGENAIFLIDALDIEKFYLIDPYEAYEEYEKQWNNQMMTEAESTAKENLGGFANVNFIKKYSEDAIADLPKNLDFVYIDGNHEYDYVKGDILNYWPIVKEGGILAGHDYTRSFPGVVEAVDEFANQKGLIVTTDLWTDWFIQKPIQRESLSQK